MRTLLLAARSLCLLTGLLAVFLFGPGSAQAQTPPGADRARFARWAYQDAVGLVQSINRQTPIYLLTGAALLSPLSGLDATIDRAVDHPGGLAGRYLRITNELGGPRMNVPVAGLFAVSLLTNSPRFQDAAFTSLQAMLYAGGLSYSLKYSLGRMRPYEIDNPYRFEPFSGRSSFPSGHTVTVFAVLTPWVLYYPHPVTYGLYALGTGGTALSRIARAKHWTTDVLAGGALGFFTAYWLTRRHQNTGPRLKLAPFFTEDAPGLSLRVKL